MRMIMLDGRAINPHAIVYIENYRGNSPDEQSMVNLIGGGKIICSMKAEAARKFINAAMDEAEAITPA
ncbi:hypothetical protein [Granulicella tundricola]|uniref:Uncharacterized protein n=1 Tax=Granulicella tundricola (strain ATCC BAA-1859 / DSM 23138 / MP5ACTX9) TaxID=1198114 RepID=E8X1U5_GRATM|nr:hypothetical protein [Granulicella tundricola]ADW69106.1 hypothetical protein AciX9_2061 [Granulicella tundricola MP5ACTX9]